MTTHIPHYEPPIAQPAITTGGAGASRSWPVLAVLAVALAMVGVIVAIALIMNDTSAGSVAVASPGESAAATGSFGSDSPTAAAPGPVAERDHWHAIYGVWSCAAGDESGDWLPIFGGTLDPVGIHSQQDGIIHIHPFSDDAAKENAQLHHFVTSMEASLTDDSLTLPNGDVLASGDDCDGEEAVLHLRKWQFDFLYQDGDAPELITKDLGAARFLNDREVWQIVHAPLDAELPQLPANRFSNLAAMAGELMPVKPLVIDATYGPDGDLIIPDFMNDGMPLSELDGMITSGEMPDEVRELIEEQHAEQHDQAEEADE